MIRIAITPAAYAAIAATLALTSQQCDRAGRGKKSPARERRGPSGRRRAMRSAGARTKGRVSVDQPTIPVLTATSGAPLIKNGLDQITKSR
jgi:hypothetical protein